MIDLLSPVGDFECLKAAVQNGADSVYLGTSSFNARARATNFDENTLKEAVKYVPEYKKVIENVSFGAGEDYASIMSCVQENGGIGTYIQAGIDRYAGHHNDYFDFDEKNLVPALNTAAISAYLILKK